MASCTWLALLCRAQFPLTRKWCLRHALVTLQSLSTLKWNPDWWAWSLILYIISRDTFLPFPITHICGFRLLYLSRPLLNMDVSCPHLCTNQSLSDMLLSHSPGGLFLPLKSLFFKTWQAFCVPRILFSFSNSFFVITFITTFNFLYSHELHNSKQIRSLFCFIFFFHLKHPGRTESVVGSNGDWIHFEKWLGL